jgi:predicted  nucleic acid-binding Zn-ribbon protein
MEQREQRLSYAEVFEAFPSELRLPIARLVDALKVEFEVPRTDFTDLKTAVQGLAEAQARTEARMEELVTAQARTEARVEELGTAQTRTEARLDRLTVAVEELAQAQKRTEHELAELAQAQARTQEEVTLFRRTFMSQIGGLSAS